MTPIKMKVLGSYNLTILNKTYILFVCHIFQLLPLHCVLQTNHHRGKLVFHWYEPSFLSSKPLILQEPLHHKTTYQEVCKDEIEQIHVPLLVSSSALLHIHFSVMPIT